MYDTLQKIVAHTNESGQLLCYGRHIRAIRNLFIVYSRSAVVEPVCRAWSNIFSEKNRQATRFVFGCRRLTNFGSR